MIPPETPIYDRADSSSTPPRRIVPRASRRAMLNYNNASSNRRPTRKIRHVESLDTDSESDSTIIELHVYPRTSPADRILDRFIDIPRGLKPDWELEPLPEQITDDIKQKAPRFENNPPNRVESVQPPTSIFHDIEFVPVTPEESQKEDIKFTEGDVVDENDESASPSLASSTSLHKWEFSGEPKTEKQKKKELEKKKRAEEEAKKEREKQNKPLAVVKRAFKTFLSFL